MSKLFEYDPPANATEALQEWFSKELSAIVQKHWRMAPNYCLFLREPLLRSGVQGLSFACLIDGKLHNHLNIGRHRISASIEAFDNRGRVIGMAIARHHPTLPVQGEMPVVIRWENPSAITSEGISDTTRLFEAIAQFRAAHRELFNQAFEEHEERLRSPSTMSQQEKDEMAAKQNKAIYRAEMEQMLSETEETFND